MQGSQAQFVFHMFTFLITFEPDLAGENKN